MTRQAMVTRATDVGDRMDDPVNRLGIRGLERRAVRLRKEAGDIVEKVGTHLECRRGIDLREDTSGQPSAALPLRWLEDQTDPELNCVHGADDRLEPSFGLAVGFRRSRTRRVEPKLDAALELG
jgi:hypothetical protein